MRYLKWWPLQEAWLKLETNKTSTGKKKLKSVTKSRPPRNREVSVCRGPLSYIVLQLIDQKPKKKKNPQKQTNTQKNKMMMVLFYSLFWHSSGHDAPLAFPLHPKIKPNGPKHLVGGSHIKPFTIWPAGGPESSPPPPKKSKTCGRELTNGENRWLHSFV